MSKKFYDNFYRLNYDWSTTDLTMRQEEDLYDDLKLLTGEVTPDKPVVFLHHLGRWPRDYIYSTGGVVLWSDRVVKALQSAGATGFRTYPVTLYDLRGKEIPGYHGISVTGRSGLIDLRKGERVQMLDPDRLKKDKFIDGIKGLYFPPDSWDGSDIFFPVGAAFIVTKKVKDTIEALKKTNIVFTPINDILTPASFIEIQQRRDESQPT